MSIGEDGVRGQTKSILWHFVRYFSKCFCISLYDHSVGQTLVFLKMSQNIWVFIQSKRKEETIIPVHNIKTSVPSRIHNVTSADKNSLHEFSFSNLIPNVASLSDNSWYWCWKAICTPKNPEWTSGYVCSYLELIQWNRRECLISFLQVKNCQNMKLRIYRVFL